MEVFSEYFMTVKPYIYSFLCFCRVCFASIYIYSAILKIPTRVSNASAGYTFYPLSLNRVGFFSINREKIRLFPSAFMRTNF